MVKSITWDVNWIVKSITCDVNWIVKSIICDVNWIVKSITCDVNWIVKSITWDVNWMVKSITWDVNWIVKSITWDVNWIVKSITWDVNWIVKAIRRDVFYSTDDVVGSKMAREMLCFTMEMAAVGCEDRSCGTAVAGYVRATLAVVRIGTVVYRLRSANQCAEYYWGLQLQIGRRLIMVAARWSWVAIGGGVLLGNAIADC